MLKWKCCSNRLQKSEDQENSSVTMAALEEKVPLMFRFLGDEDDDVSAAVIPFVQDYIGILKQMKQISPKHREHIEVQTVHYIKNFSGYRIEEMLISVIYVHKCVGVFFIHLVKLKSNPSPCH